MVYRPQDRIWTAAALTVCPLTTDDLKDHLRITGEYEDATVASLGIAATATAEAFTQRLMSARTCTLLLTDLPSGVEPIELPGGEIVSVTSVMADGTPITGCTAVGHSPALLLPSTDWPTVTGNGYPVTITYVAGVASLPFDLRAAIKLVAGELYEQRANMGEGSLTEISTSARMLLARHRIWAI